MAEAGGDTSAARAQLRGAEQVHDRRKQVARQLFGTGRHWRGLNLGCGASPRDGWLNMDIVDLAGVDLVWDMMDLPWPIPDASLAGVEASHVLEHVPHTVLGSSKNGLVLLVEEIHRVLEPGGVLHARFPDHRSTHAWIDPTHTRVVHPGQFLYFSEAHADRFPGWYSQARFADVRWRHNHVFRLAWHAQRHLGVRVPSLPVRFPGWQRSETEVWVTK